MRHSCMTSYMEDRFTEFRFLQPEWLILPWKQCSLLTNSASISGHDVAVERLYARLRYIHSGTSDNLPRRRARQINSCQGSHLTPCKLQDD